MSAGNQQVAACIRQWAARWLFAARQWLVRATIALTSADPEAATGIGKLAHDVLSLIGAAVVALGQPAVRCALAAPLPSVNDHEK